MAGGVTGTEGGGATTGCAFAESAQQPTSVASTSRRVRFVLPVKIIRLLNFNFIDAIFLFVRRN